MTLARQRLLIFFVPLLLALPFINRAYFVDDNFFVEIARWIKDNPARPYDFSTHGENSAGVQALSGKETLIRIWNPLLHQYYIAGLMKVGGEKEWFLRLGCVLFSCFSALLLFELARRWLDHALLGTLLVLVTPVHWVTSYSLLIDPTMACFFLLGLYAWIRSAEEDSAAWAAGAGVSIGLALVTKYTAMLALPVIGTWLLLNWKSVRRPWLAALPAVISLAFLALYVYATKRLYGTGHLFAASAESLVNVSFGKMLVLLEFLSGAAIAPLVVWAAFSRRLLAAGFLLFVVLTSLLASSLGGFDVKSSALMALWLSTSLLVLMSAWQTDRFLGLWLYGFIAMMVFVMPWVAARYFLIGLPPLVFCAARFVEKRRPAFAKPLLLGAIVVTGIVGLAIGYADYKQAESGRFLVSELRRQNFLEGARNHYFAATFTMTYLSQQNNWKPASDLRDLRPGDRVVTSEVTFPLFWRFRNNVPLKLIATVEYPASFPIKVMDARNGAGFYGSAWGPFPFSVAKGPWERFHLFEIMPAS